MQRRAVDGRLGDGQPREVLPQLALRQHGRDGLLRDRKEQPALDVEDGRPLLASSVRHNEDGRAV